MPQSNAVKAGLIGGCLLLFGAGVFLLGTSAPEPVQGSGEVGRVVVFGQIPFGPVEALVDKPSRFPRPQYLAFQFTSSGTGPRYIRIELEANGLTSVVFEERIGAPKVQDSLEFVLELGDDQPNEVTVITTIEAPHAESVTRRHPLHLIGPERRFWEDGAKQ